MTRLSFVADEMIRSSFVVLLLSLFGLERRQALSEGKTDLDKAAFLIVTGVWSPVSLIESPVLYTKEDGTQVRELIVVTCRTNKDFGSIH